LFINYREIEPWYTAEQIRAAAHILNASRFNHQFQQWFVPQYQRGRGQQDYSIICGHAAEHIIDMFADIWNSHQGAVKLPRGRRKCQVIITSMNYWHLVMYMYQTCDSK